MVSKFDDDDEDDEEVSVVVDDDDDDDDVELEDDNVEDLVNLVISANQK